MYIILIFPYYILKTDSSKQGCKPLFLISRHGAPVGAVDGLNTAVLMMLVDLHVPKPEKKESK